jgi:hypothetical protein
MSHSPGRLSPLVGALGLALAATVGGCGGVTPAAVDGGGDAAQSVTAQEGCNQVAKALCDALDSCAPSAVMVLYGDKATCITRAALSCTTDQSVAGIQRTGDDLVSCARALGAATCPDLLAGNFPDVCAVKPGATINGAACGSDWQCQSTYCGKTDKCGVCGPRQAAGGDCTVDGGCGKGLVCGAKKCVAPAGPNADCNLPAQPCRSDLYCTSATGSGKCAAKLGAGGACMDSDQACDFIKGAVCNPLNHVCVTVNVAKGGEACGLGNKTICVGFVAPCSNILTGGVCANPAQDGEACGMNKVCVPPATCETGVCRLPSAIGCQ